MFQFFVNQPENQQCCIHRAVDQIHLIYWKNIQPIHLADQREEQAHRPENIIVEDYVHGKSNETHEEEFPEEWLSFDEIE